MVNAWGDCADFSCFFADEISDFPSCESGGRINRVWNLWQSSVGAGMGASRSLQNALAVAFAAILGSSSASAATARAELPSRVTACNCCCASERSTDCCCGTQGVLEPLSALGNRGASESTTVPPNSRCDCRLTTPGPPAPDKRSTGSKNGRDLPKRLTATLDVDLNSLATSSPSVLCIRSDAGPSHARLYLRTSRLLI